jgi:hypothetical protein
MGWRIAAPSNIALGGQPIGVISDKQRHPTGAICQAYNDATPPLPGGEFIYLQTAAAILNGSWVTFTYDTGAVTLLAAGALGPIALSQVAGAASNWCWYQITGKASNGLVLANALDASKVYASATPGSVSTTLSATNLIIGLVSASAQVGTVGEFSLNRPLISGLG